jgi:hypothetical protein
VRRLFEPKAPPIQGRIEALQRLHDAGVRTFAMIAPLLPGAEELPCLLAGKVDHVLVDRMNYGYGSWVYRKHGMEDCLTDEFFQATAQELASAFERAGVSCRIVF